MIRTKLLTCEVTNFTSHQTKQKQTMSRASTPTFPSLNNHPTMPDSAAAAAAATASSDPYFNDSSVIGMDQFANTLTNIESMNVCPDLLASIITHYASKWLPELSSDRTPAPASSTANWLKKRFFVQNLVNILPSEKGSMPCEFLLRLLRAARMVRAGSAYIADLEARVAYQLDQASLKEVMIPAFSHTCGTLLDVGLVVRLVRKFLASSEAARNGVQAMVKVAKLVDSYLAEVALDAGLTVAEFEQLATAMPSHARAADDGQYRAVDTYIKAHPNTTKQEKKALSKLIDPRKLTREAALHAIHNDRLPVRSVIQILFSEQTKLNRISEWSGSSFSGVRSPSPALEAPGRCPSKREVLSQQHEMRKLKEDMARLQTQCRVLQAQIDRLGSDKKKKGIFRWSNFLFRNTVDRSFDDYEAGIERRTPRTPMDGLKGRLVHRKGTPPRRRSSLS